MPAHRKPDDQRQDNRRERGLVLVDPAAHEVATPGRIVPKPERRWLKATTSAWTTFWHGDIGVVLDQVDLPALYRLFELRDMQERAFRRYRKEPYVPGSTGQPVTNPEFANAMAMEKAILALEDRAGLSPKARANLGIAIGQAKLTAEELNRRARDEAERWKGDDDSGDSDTDDIGAGWEQA